MTTTRKLLLATVCNAALLAFCLVDAASIRRGQGHMLNVNDLSKMDQGALLRNAIKVDKRLYHRILEDQGEGQEQEGGQDQEGQEQEGQEQEGQEQEQEQANEAEEEREGENEAEEQVEGEDEQAEEEEQPQEEAAGEEEQVEEEQAQQILQLRFLKCGAFTVDPNVIDVDAMLEAGEINEDQAAEMKAAYITEVTDYLFTQESMVFFTVGYGDDDQERELYMTNLDNWISASMGYQDVCHQLNEDDVDTIFSTVTDTTFAELYAGHSWYSGFNCMEDGSGFGSQLFLDPTCTTYAPAMSNYYPFPEGSNVMANQDAEEEGAAEGEEAGAAEEEEQANVDYSNRVASDLTPYMLQNADYFLQSSHYCEEVEGAEAEQGAEGDQQQAAAQAMEFCQNLFGVSVDVVTCNLYGREGEQNQQGQQEEECECVEEEQAGQEAEGEGEQANEEQAEGDEPAEGEDAGNGERKRRRNQECECAQQDSSAYQINYEDVGNVEASCSTLRSLFGIDPNSFTGMDAEYVVSKWSNVRDGHQSSSSSNSNKGWIIALVVLAVVVVIAVFVVLRSKNKKAASGSSKTEPLVSSSNKPSRKKKESIEIYFQGSKP